MDTKDTEYSVSALLEITDYFREKMEHPIPIDIAIQLKRYIRNVEDVIALMENH